MVSLVKLFSVIVTLAASVSAAPAVEPQIAKRAVGLQTSCPGGPVYAGYFRSWRDVAADSTNPQVKMSDLPAGTDIAFVFPMGSEDPGFWTTLRDSYVPALHARGTKLVRTVFIDRLLKVAVPADGNYDAIAQQLIGEFVTPWGLDGIDIDMEQSLTSAQATHSANIIIALSKYLGPRSSKPGTYLIYDTNEDVHELAIKVAPYVNYIQIQAYGRNGPSLQSTWNGYAPYYSSCQFSIGFSFYEERGAYWGDSSQPFWASNAANYAQWNPAGGKKGGLFSYAIDRDWKDYGDDTLTVPTYEYSKQLIPLNKQYST
ncbi:Endo-beta-N-acetylglucosaminidase F2 [Vanrija pseudolonga]|uniref:Endo-beta-N-acetylglucosaminidase F2 n=1 Tax=Vanrija pseudolonga TaxID=143232 RepID=A0AAF0Y5D5_9TREE|nr:Endo-beta-N-acetylglucosaminidase F2 [Vanrija pseudolonga]